MAYGFSAVGLSKVDVVVKGSANSFSGVQSFTGGTNSTSTSTGQVVITGGLGVSGNIYGGAVYGAIWNDLVDCIEVPEETILEPGYAYCTDGQNYYKSTKYMDDGFIAFESDTSGFVMGDKGDKKVLHAGITGFILCYVDKEYKPGTPLTCTADGKLTELKEEDLTKYPNKLLATYWKPEKAEKWGPIGQEILVNNRQWVKIF